MKTKRNSGKLPMIYGAIAPSFLLYIFIVFVPLITTVYYSLNKWAGLGALKFIGLDNYKTLLGDRIFWQAAGNNLVIVIYCVLGQVGIALLISFLMTAKTLRLKEFHRTVIFFPVVLAPVVIGFVWRFIYNTEYGMLNSLLRLLGLDNLIRPWLDDAGIVLTTVSVPVMWQFVGLYLVILMGAISSIPSEVLEMAEIDGASGLKKSIYITLPMIWDTLKIAIILCASGTMKIYDHIFVMTNGGPGRASTVLALYCYDTTFRIGNFGYGSTISVGILVISFLITGIIQFSMGRKKNA